MTYVKTIKEFERDKKKCKYCNGKGLDLFDKNKPCPNCSKDKIIIIKKHEIPNNN